MEGARIRPCYKAPSFGTAITCAMHSQPPLCQLEEQPYVSSEFPVPQLHLQEIELAECLFLSRVPTTGRTS